MKSLRARGLLAAAGVFVMSGLVLAHHGDSGRYEDTLTTVTGTVAEVQFINPHSVLIVDVPDGAPGSGKVVRWNGELGSRQVLIGWCWNKDTVKVGEKITMVGRRLKSGAPFMTLSENSKVIDAKGKEIFRGNIPGAPPNSAKPPCANSTS